MEREKKILFQTLKHKYTVSKKTKLNEFVVDVQLS